jgi:hypothetical protein
VSVLTYRLTAWHRRSNRVSHSGHQESPESLTALSVQLFLIPQFYAALERADGVDGRTRDARRGTVAVLPLYGSQQRLGCDTDL